MSQQQKGLAAQELLGNQLIRDFFEDFEKTINNGFWACEPDNMEGIKMLLSQKEAMKLLKGYLEGYVLLGKQALDILKTASKVEA